MAAIDATLRLIKGGSTSSFPDNTYGGTSVCSIGSFELWHPVQLRGHSDDA